VRARGAAVVVADIDGNSAEATAELARAEGGEATVVVADAADEDGVRAMFAAAGDALGGLDGLVLNVGIGGGWMLKGTSAEDWDRVMAVNLRSQFLGCKHALEAMTDGGAVVLVGSIASREVLPFPAYGASKAALESLCRQAAVEGSPGIRANLLMPGLIDTSLGRLASAASPLRDQVKIPAGRQGTAWEIAYAAVFLLSGESSYVTGQSLIVDGGLTSGPRA
jgi:NAD(P)-dependent dehydrogenase (short-subunit alcohol dehydrogenase family)